jgi:hypothetical protein
MWTFTGREVSWISARGTGRGSARVYVDGKYAATVNLRTGTAGGRQVVFRKIFTSTGSHSISIRPTGSGRVDLDGFLALRH